MKHFGRYLRNNHQMTTQLEISLNRDVAISALTRFFNDNRAPQVKKVRIEASPMDKHGDLVNLIVYVFNTAGSYDMFFPKRVRLPNKYESRENFNSVLTASLEKIMPACASIVQFDGMTDGAAMMEAVLATFKEEEQQVIDGMSQFDRTDFYIDQAIEDGSLAKIVKEQADKTKAAQEELELAMDRLDAMTDQELLVLVMNEIILCKSDVYEREMRPKWIQMGIQYDVTQLLHDVVSLIANRGQKMVPKWGEDGMKDVEDAGFYREFHSYRGLVAEYNTCAVDSGYNLYKEDGTHLITI
jgi:hypothetical protein